MPKYMFNASYTTEGVQGLLSEGGIGSSGRRKRCDGVSGWNP